MTPLTDAPTLRTERLTLRGPAREDMGPYVAWSTASPRLAAMGDLVTAGEAWRGFLLGVGHWRWHGYGFFTLRRHEDPAPLGRVGLLGWEADVELAWHLFDAAEGRGYATEAARAVRGWAYDTHAVDRLVSYIDHRNARSQAVARRLGARTDGARAAHDPEAEIWIHERPAP